MARFNHRHLTRLFLAALPSCQGQTVKVTTTWGAVNSRRQPVHKCAGRLANKRHLNFRPGFLSASPAAATLETHFPAGPLYTPLCVCRRGTCTSLKASLTLTTFCIAAQPCSFPLPLAVARPTMSFLAKFAASKYVGDKLEENFGPEVHIFCYPHLIRNPHPAPSPGTMVEAQEINTNTARKKRIPNMTSSSPRMAAAKRPRSPCPQASPSRTSACSKPSAKRHGATSGGSTATAAAACTSSLERRRYGACSP